jgi:hypothetical protein
LRTMDCNNRGPGSTWRKGLLGCAVVVLTVAPLTACDSDLPKYDAGSGGHTAVSLLHCAAPHAHVHVRSCDRT